MKPSILILLAALCVSQASARTWNILEDGSGDAPTVQAGIDSAAVGDTVLVGPGTYLENINFLGKDIVVKSEVGPEATIIDGSGASNTVVLFFNEEGSGTVLDGFTITGGSGHVQGVFQADGGGIFIRACSPTIRNNHIVNNHAAPMALGGGIYISAAQDPSKTITPIIEENFIASNSAMNGGGMAVLWGNPIIRGNAFQDNEAEFDGAGVFLWMREGSPTVIDNTFIGNVARDHGGGIYAANRQRATSMLIERNVIARNTAWGLGTGDTGSGGGIWTANFPGKILNNTIVLNLGFGETVCGGGGIALDVTPADLRIENNIIAFNNSCGVSERSCVIAFELTDLRSHAPGWGYTGDRPVGSERARVPPPRPQLNARALALLCL